MNRLRNAEFVIVDVETTGLSPFSGDRVIEIAALKVKDLKIQKRFQTLINPEREVSWGAFMVNGISNEMLIGAPKAKEVLKDFLSFIDGTHLVGHNVPFDLKFLNYEFKLAGHAPINNVIVFDTVTLARQVVPRLNSYSLAYLSQILGIKEKQEHRAMSDVEMTFEVLCRLFKMADEKSSATQN